MRRIRWVLAQLICFYAWVILKTARWRFENEELKAEAFSHGRVMYTFWHTNICCWYSYLFCVDTLAMSNLVLGGPKGEVLGPMCRFFRLTHHYTCPDNDPLTNARAVASVAKDMKEGYNSFIAPDGPDGPAYVPKPGIATISMKANAVILPMAMKPNFYFRLTRWDRTIIPLPFTKFTVTYGEPIYAAQFVKCEEVLAEISTRLDSCIEGYKIERSSVAAASL